MQQTISQKNVPGKGNARQKARRRKSIFFLLCFGLICAAVLTCTAASGDVPPPLESLIPNTDAYAALPDSAALDVQLVWQNPELPNGCESTSLCTVLRYFGFPATKTEIAYEYIPYELLDQTPQGYYAPDPAEKYAGDPATSLGFYCFEQPVIQASNQYFIRHESTLAAIDLSGANVQTLKTYLANGMPVLLWCTQNYGAEATYHDAFSWFLPSGSNYIPYSNLHCVVLVGYDEYCFTLCDPLEGELQIAQPDLLAAYQALGSHAVSFSADSV